MKALKILFGVMLAMLMILSSISEAQVLATAETGGQGSKAVLITANGISSGGLGLFNGWAQFAYIASCIKVLQKTCIVCCYGARNSQQ